MAAGSEASLYASTDSSLWKAALGCYEEVVGLVMAQKKKKPKSESLVQLDKWWAVQTGNFAVCLDSCAVLGFRRLFQEV